MRILTSFNAGRVKDARHLIESLRAVEPTVPVRCYISGIGQPARDWFEARGCELVDIDSVPAVEQLKPRAVHFTRGKPGRWMSLVRPWLFAHAGGRSLWIDPDCVVLRPIQTEAETILATGPLLTTGNPTSLNRKQLYKRTGFALPLGHTPWLTAQSGVMGLDADRDTDLLADWQNFMARAWADREAETIVREISPEGVPWRIARKRIVWGSGIFRDMRGYEQGALLVAIHKNGLAGSMFHDYRWNAPRELDGQAGRRRYQTGPDLYERIAAVYGDEINIVHYADRPKLSQLLYGADGRLDV